MSEKRVFLGVVVYLFVLVFLSLSVFAVQSRPAGMARFDSVSQVPLSASPSSDR